MTNTGLSCLDLARAIALTAAVVLCGASPSLAGDFARSGFYIAGGASYVTADVTENEVEDALPGVSADFEDAPGFNIRAGVRLLAPLAIELQYEWLDDYDLELSFSGVSGTVNLKQQTLTANLKVYPFPIWRIQPYLLAGVGFQHVEVNASGGGGLLSYADDDTVVAARGAVGLDVYLTEHIAVFGEAGVTYADYEVGIPSVLGNDIDFLLYVGGQVGVTWRF